MKYSISLLCAGLLLTACEQLPASLQSMNPSFDETQKVLATSETATIETNIEVVKTNGLTAWLAEDHSLPLVSMQLAFEGAGSSLDPKGKEGRAMFAAALLDEGAGDLSALEFQEKLEDHAIQLAFSTNEDVLLVQLRCLSEHLPEAMRLINLALKKPNFTPKDIERKRASALSTLSRAKSQPGYQLSKRFSQLAYAGHPYSSPPLGSEQSLNNITRSDLLDYVNRAITKNRLTISVAGDVSPQTLDTLMATYLADLPAASAPHPVNDIAIQNQGTLHIEPMDVPQSQVLVASPAVNRQDERFLAAYVLSHIIGGDTMTSVLGTAIREKKGLAYSVNSSLDPMQHSSSFKVSFATNNAQVSEAYATLKDEMKTLAEQGVSDAQLKDAIDYLTGSFVLSLDSNTPYTYYLGTMQRFNLGKDYLQTRNQKIRAVTKQQVNALAKEMLDPDKWLTVVVGMPEKLEFKRSPNP